MLVTRASHTYFTGPPIVFRAALFALFALTTALSSAIGDAAEAYPSKPLRLIVPFAPGGAADILARVIGEHLQRDLGKPIVIVNREGAGTIIGVDAAAKATPDGYTLLLSGPQAIAVRLAQRPAADFACL
jgi:tripartite-type tricarboxylate transporter receptor subunit TctC